MPPECVCALNQPDTNMYPLKIQAVHQWHRIDGRPAMTPGVVSTRDNGGDSALGFEGGDPVSYVIDIRLVLSLFVKIQAAPIL